MDWGKGDRVPLLLIAGTEDHVVPASSVKGTKAKYHGPVRHPFTLLPHGYGLRVGS